MNKYFDPKRHVQFLRRRPLRLALSLDPDYQQLLAVPPGHYYSPLLKLDELAAQEQRFLDPQGVLWRHIDLRAEDQLRLLNELAEKTSPPKFPAKETDSYRYYSDNPSYRYGSAFLLAAMMQLFRPRRIIEVGCGATSAAILDTSDYHKLDVHLTCIEPFPDFLRSLLRKGNSSNVTIVERLVQEVQTSVFEGLEANDFLFIDSSHVAKVGSDVCDLFLRVIPVLKIGCLVHFHDIFYPGTYPREWLLRGRAWNETYLLRTFLMFNGSFRVLFSNSFVGSRFREAVARHWPYLVSNTGGDIGSSFWLQRVA